MSKRLEQIGSAVWVVLWVVLGCWSFYRTKDVFSAFAASAFGSGVLWLMLYVLPVFICHNAILLFRQRDDRKEVLFNTSNVFALIFTWVVATHSIAHVVSSSYLRGH